MKYLYIFDMKLCFFSSSQNGKIEFGVFFYSNVFVVTLYELAQFCLINVLLYIRQGTVLRTEKVWFLVVEKFVLLYWDFGLD